MDAYERQGRQAWIIMIIQWIKHGFKMFRMYVFYIYIYIHIQCIHYTNLYSMCTVCLYVCDYTYIHYITLHYITLHYITLHIYMYMGMGQNSVPLVNSKIAGNHPPTNDVYI